MDFGLASKKLPNPREKANPLSVATFSYTLPTFIQGFKKELEVLDLPETLTEHQSARLGNKLEKAWREEEIKAAKSKRQPSLRRALFKTFGFEFIIYGLVLAFTEFSTRVTQPLLLGQLIAYYTPNQTEISEKDAYIYAGGVVLCSLIAVFLTHPYVMGFFHVGMKMRVACCSLIYRKALRLSKTALGETTAGQVVNLLSNDVNRFDIAVTFAHQLWVGPIETIVVTYFMYQEVGISAVFGVVFLLLFIPLQIGLAKRAAVLRLRTALRTDERVRLMNEIITGIQVIKMYTWEKPLAKLVSLSRRYEIKSIRGASYIRGIFYSFMMFTTRISLFITILSYVLFGEDINAKQVFVLTAFYNVLRHTMTMFFPQAIGQIAEANVSVKRLNKFMLYEEIHLAAGLLKSEKNGTLSLDKLSISDSKPKKVYYDNTTNAIAIKNATAKWSDASNDNTLSNLSLNVKRGSLIAVIGPVGSGKTSLLHAILKELPLLEGSLQINGEISYASQEPWLFSGPVRQNILFGSEMDKIRYKNVVNKCALQRDFTLLPYGDKTIVGERGVSLSGGQRARINLARAVYKEADIYLLDDPLSAVDTHVGKQLFDDCIMSYLRDKTVILVTHQLQYLKDADYLIILENGQVKAEGTYNQLQDSGLDFAKLLSHESETSEQEDPERVPGDLAIKRAISVASGASIDEQNADDPTVAEEQKGTGSISSLVYRAYITAGANWFVVFIVFMLFILTQLAGSAGDYFITHWVNLEQERSKEVKYAGALLERSASEFHNANYSEINSNTRIDSDSFWYFSTETCIYIYSGITAATIIITLARSLTFFNLCMRASVKLHDNMFNSIILATMRFFNTNSSGRILNRFSKDMGSVDELLPAATIDCIQIGLALVGIIVVVAIVDPFLLIPTLVIGVLFYLLRIFYLSTSRNVKRIEGVTRSPVFAHLNASLQGLTTIRAFGAQKVLEREFDSHQDLHSSAWYLFIATSRAFGYWLDIICVIYIGIVTLSFLLLGNEQYGGNVGLAITQSLGLTGMFQWGMRQSAEMENQMTSVERILEYSSVKHEPPLESPPNKTPPKTWPEFGEIKFVNLFLRYFPEDPHVLRNLNFTVKPLEKVGIVGRTGAGKSSLITALFQLTSTEGSILIDEIEIQGIGLHDLRSKISIIPQEPVLFSGTMRKNLDPFDEYSDEVLWKSLEEVELKEAVNDLAGGLNSKMSEGGTNFSVGQRQLVCLARAIIRNNKILVLDEATANVDPQTDALIQKTIRRKFANCTVLTIAHRLHTVMDSDKVLVMDAGTMIEFDAPHILLQNTNGIFYGMVQQTGKNMAENLIKIAEDSYKQSQTKHDSS